ncbi:hypothetical protein JCGZ_21309 [Jatropha curcas]|uniref:Uncharacterized protein n=1 Tax=Jatropha curcas TaxID=180498 RepID=A0A067JDK9_JATCU|nr:hypothetical protein JCGZ_21309 [Jatropha curcas]
MAYYGSSYYMEDGGGEYNSSYPLTPYYNNSYYDSPPIQDSMATAYYTYNSNDPIPFFGTYDSVSSYSRIAYAVSATSEPKHMEYDPVPYYSAQTRFITSYSVSQFNEPDFEEYDPTPYGGGYDQTVTYGKPLPPSDQTCYPRSTPDPVILPLNEKEELKEDTPKPETQTKPTEGAETEQEQQQQSSFQEEESKEKSVDDYYPWSGSTGVPSVSQVPYGYGLEAMDICEGLFGYWPCLSRYRRKWDECEQDCGNRSTQWNMAADYLFGSPNPYSQRNDDGSCSWNGMYSYQRQYQQVEYVEGSWSTP